MRKISVIIPTLNAADGLAELLACLAKQTLRPAEVLVVDSASTDDTVAIAEACEGVRVLHIAREAFDHGGTRDWALGQCEGEIICFLTQDALPTDDGYLQNLIAPFEDERVGCACGRQVARADASEAERLTRVFNYPEQSFIRSAQDIQRLGVKTYFLSDACSAYRRDAYTAVGGFEHPILVNEDMLLAARMIHGGYQIAYCAQARVWHSHQYSFWTELRRNFDIGAFLKMHANDLPSMGEMKEGVRLVKEVSKTLLSRGRVCAWIGFGFNCAARFLGNRLGKLYERLPRRWILRLSGQRAYWMKKWEEQP